MAKTLELSCVLEADIDQVRAAILRPALFLHVASPLIVFSPMGLDRFPDIWAAGEYRGSMKLFGLIPVGWQAIVIEMPGSGSSPSEGDLVLRDRGYGPLLRVWDHRIEARAHPKGTLYTDRLTLDAGWMTPVTAFFVKRFFEHRQRRLRGAARDGFSALK